MERKGWLKIKEAYRKRKKGYHKGKGIEGKNGEGKGEKSREGRRGKTVLLTIIFSFIYLLIFLLVFSRFYLPLRWQFPSFYVTGCSVRRDEVTNCSCNSSPDVLDKSVAYVFIPLTHNYLDITVFNITVFFLKAILRV